MEKFYLEKPSINRKQDALNYLNEHIQYKSKINGNRGLNRCINDISYEQWLEEVLNMPNEEYAKSLGYVPGYTYFLIRREDDKIIGMINIRYNLTEEMLTYAGHIGYGVRPSERRKGYAKLQLYLALKKANELSLDKVMISCDETNEASDRTIKSLGGVFERKQLEQDRSEILNIYWINVEKSIEKYKNKYEKYVKGDDENEDRNTTNKRL